MKYCIIGRHGLIGSALSAQLWNMGHEVTSNPTKEVSAVIHLASPTHLEFDKNPEYHAGEAIRSFELLLPFCKANRIPFIYASSALVYEPEKKSPFRNCKIILEQLAEASGANALGLRIFPVYGVGESRTAISQWCRKMLNGESPVVYGDGNQVRDFIYVDDVVDTIVGVIQKNWLWANKIGIMDVGSGKPIRFNDIIKTINEELGAYIPPRYEVAPTGYSNGIICRNPVKIKVSLSDGIRKIILGQQV